MQHSGDHAGVPGPEQAQTETENKAAATIAAQLDNIVMDKYGGDRAKALEDPAFRKQLSNIHGSMPGNIRALNEETNMTVTKNPNRDVGDGYVVMTGESDVNGKQTLATAHGKTVADDPEEPAIAHDYETMWTQIDAMGYQQWRAERMFALVPAQALVAEFLSTFKEYPPRQRPASFSIDQVLERMQQPPQN